MCKFNFGRTAYENPDINLQFLISWLNSVVVIRHGLTPTWTLWVSYITAESAFRVWRTLCERGHFTSVEAWRVCESLLNESLNADGMLFEHHVEHSSKCTNLVFQLLNSPSVEKSTHIAFGFAVIISTVGSSYQVWVYFINSFWRLSLPSVACGSFGYNI